MYIIARREGETITIAGGLITLKVISVTGKIARIGIEAPKGISVTRDTPEKKGQTNDCTE